MPPLALKRPTAAASFSRRDLLRWLYTGRLALVTGVFGGTLFVWQEAHPAQTLVVTLSFLLGVGVTAVSAWHTVVRDQDPGESFLYGQVAFDSLLVTGFVYVTSNAFAPLYILVITAGALLLPLRGGLLIGILVSILYSAAVIWSDRSAFGWDVGFQIGLFTLVAIVTGLVGDKLRRAGLALGEVESELRQLRLGTEDILANISTGVITVDPAGRLLYLNPAGETLLGLRAAEWLDSPIIGELDRIAPGLASVIRRSGRERRSLSRLKSIARIGDGREATYGISTAVLVRGKEQEPTVTVIFQDITDQERLAELNRRNERLEAVAELSASLAHEIKNPLASIRSSVEQIARSRLSEEDRETLERLVLEESDRLSRLLTQFIEYSAVRMRDSAPVDLRQLVFDCTDLVRAHPDAPETVTLHLDLGDEAAEISGDRDLLHIAIFNLILNAVQFSAPSGRVEVAVRSAEGVEKVRGFEVKDPVLVRVSDSGPGIPPDRTARVFDPFFTTRKGGSGLGLSVVHRAVEAHQGVVFVDRADELGGAEFLVVLPSESEGDTFVHAGTEALADPLGRLEPPEAGVEGE